MYGKSNFTTDQKQFEKVIRQAIKDKLSSGFDKVKSSLEEATRKLVIQGIREQPAYHHILHGRLKNELGLTDEVAQTFMTGLEDLIKKKIKLHYKMGSGKTIATIILDLLVLNLDEIYSLPGASYISEPSGSTINWSLWTLEKGLEIIVGGYDVSREGTSVKSRSSSGMVMIKSGNKMWRMPRGLSGTKESNYIVNGIVTKIDEIELAMIRSVMKIFS